MENKHLQLLGTVVVTGGSRGIGKACALTLADNGYDILFTWHSSKKEALSVEKRIKNMGRACTALNLRLESDDLEEKFRVIDKLISSPLVGLVNNAAIDGGRESFIDTKNADWLRIFEVNVFAIMELSREAFKRMAISRGGSGGAIVNLSSQLAIYGNGKLTPYSASKGAVNSLTVSLAKEMGHEKVRVNCVSPGLLDQNQDPSITRLHQSRISEIPIGRLGTTSDVSEAVTWLISPRSSFITGVILPVHGGR